MTPLPMRLKNIAKTAALAILVSACALFSKAREENLAKVQVGQSESEVIAAIGEPSDKSPSGKTELWHYDIISADERTYYPYTGHFENGKLTSWFFDTARTGKPSTEQPGRRERSKRAPSNGP